MLTISILFLFAVLKLLEWGRDKNNIKVKNTAHLLGIIYFSLVAYIITDAMRLDYEQAVTTERTKWEESQSKDLHYSSGSSE